MMRTGLNLAIWWIVVLSVLIGGTVGAKNSTLGRQRRQDCDGFRCKNGECIDIDLKCDGKEHCTDGSDETNNCKDLMCRGNIFRCSYGACISKKLVCDGKNDCRDGSDENNRNCANYVNPNCKVDEFQCKNKRCISIDNKCDGTPDCTDLSDETEEACLQLICPGNTFKCKYGACISRRGRCNGISECYDGSDESAETCGGPIVTTSPVTKTPTVTSSPPPNKRRPPNTFTRGSCILPPKVENGVWSVWLNYEYDYEPGDLVLPGTTLQVDCKKGYVVLETQNEKSLSLCSNGVWSVANHNCIRICRPIPTTPNTIVTCINNGAEISCKAPTEGTTARFTCPRFYELTTDNHIRSCTEGTWDDDIPHCIAVCGQESVVVKELIIGGKRVKKGFYPWTIALYRRHNETAFSHICGGSLISERIVVTAAHCVTDTNGKKMEEAIYRVAAGKYFRTYDHPNDTDAEFSEIHEIAVYKKYKSSILHYVGDIALLVTTEPFNATQFIQRICVDWDPYSTYEGKLINTNGVVTGWGYTKRGREASEVLKQISLPYVDFNQCYDATPDKYKSFVTDDKMCAGYINEGVGVCEGDSGGGLAFLSARNQRFYLRGIVSTAPQVNESCDEYKYAFYTKVSVYIPFMKPIVQRYERQIN